jgi:hypothetical protein
LMISGIAITRLARAAYQKVFPALIRISLSF